MSKRIGIKTKRNENPKILKLRNVSMDEDKNIILKIIYINVSILNFMDKRLI